MSDILLAEFMETFNALKTEEQSLLSALSLNRDNQRKILLSNCKKEYGFGIGDKVQMNRDRGLTNVLTVGVIVNIIFSGCFMKIVLRTFNKNGKIGAKHEKILITKSDIEFIQVVEEAKHFDIHTYWRRNETTII